MLGDLARVGAPSNQAIEVVVNSAECTRCQVIADNRDELVAWLRSSTDACLSAVFWVESLPPNYGLDRAWAICVRSDWMMWLTPYLAIPDDVMRLIACDFARAVLHLVPPGEEQPRLAIETAERFACGVVTACGCDDSFLVCNIGCSYVNIE